MSLEEIQSDLIEVLESYGFKTSIKVPSGVNGYLKLIDDDNKYVFAICNKYISDCTEDEEHSKKIKLILRFKIYVGTYIHNLGKTEISFDYATGGNSGSEVNSKEDIEKVVRQNLHCHSLYTYEELDKLKSKNKVQNLFDFLEEEEK